LSDYLKEEYRINISRNKVEKKLVKILEQEKISYNLFQFSEMNKDNNSILSDSVKIGIEIDKKFAYYNVKQFDIILLEDDDKTLLFVQNIKFRRLRGCERDNTIYKERIKKYVEKRLIKELEK